MRQRTGAIVCPRCERLIAANEKRCPNCGTWQPGMFGYGPALSRWLGGSLDITNAITLTCVALYVLSLALDPMAIFQGSEDKVVPPNQSEVVVAALRSRGIPHIYRLYEGEGHGFRKSETTADFLQQVERFLQQYVLFSV